MEYFLDRVIKPDVEIEYTGQFDEMLKVLENSDDPPVKFLAGEIKKFFNEEKSSSLNVSHHGHFGNLPSLLAAGIYPSANVSKRQPQNYLRQQSRPLKCSWFLNVMSVDGENKTC